MASIKCTNCGAVLKTQTAIAPGKKAKCPKCSEVFVVQAEEQPADEPKGKSAPPPSPFSDLDDSAAAGGEEKAAPKKKGKADDEDDGEETPKKKGKDGKPKKSNTALIIGIVAAVLVLCCCCPGGCGGITFLNEDFRKEFWKGFDEAQKKSKK